MSEGKSWYETGYEGAKREQDRMQQEQGPRRFWMPPDSERDLVFIDDEPICIWEHNPKMNGQWQNWMTCLKGIVEDPPCCSILGVRSRYYVGFLSVIDCTPYTDKKGNTYQFEQKLFPAKVGTLQKLRRKKELRGSLAGTMWKVGRTGKRSPSCGDDFDFLKEVDNPKRLFDVTMFKGKKLSELWDKAMTDAENLNRLKAVFQVDIDDGKPIPRVVPFNYFEVLRPMDADVMRSFLQGSSIDSSSSFGGDSSDSSEDDVPF